jgi:aryl-alcohol dehydrogenase-like predicted oxidoreductase
MESTNSGLQDTFNLGADLSVRRLGFGAMRLTGPGVWGWPKNISEAHRILRRVTDLGINFIDTADSYGPEVAELLIADALYPYPSGLVIATKGRLYPNRAESMDHQWTSAVSHGGMRSESASAQAGAIRLVSTSRCRCARSV